MLHREGGVDWAPSSLHLKFMVHRSGGEDAVPSPLHPSSTAHRSDRESLVPSLLKWESMVDSVLSPLHSWLEASLGF